MMVVVGFFGLVLFLFWYKCPYFDIHTTVKVKFCRHKQLPMWTISNKMRPLPEKRMLVLPDLISGVALLSQLLYSDTSCIRTWSQPADVCDLIFLAKSLADSQIANKMNTYYMTLGYTYIRSKLCMVTSTQRGRRWSESMIPLRITPAFKRPLNLFSLLWRVESENKLLQGWTSHKASNFKRERESVQRYRGTEPCQ